MFKNKPKCLARFFKFLFYFDLVAHLRVWYGIGPNLEHETTSKQTFARQTTVFELVYDCPNYKGNLLRSAKCEFYRPIAIVDHQWQSSKNVF